MRNSIAVLALLALSLPAADGFAQGKKFRSDSVRVMHVLFVDGTGSSTPMTFLGNSAQVIDDTTATFAAIREYAAGKRLLIMQADDYDDAMKISSTKTGTVPGSNAWPFWFYVGSTVIQKLYEDSLVVAGEIKAESFRGDGSNLTGVTGSVLAAPDDLELEGDTNDDRNGSVIFVLADTNRAKLFYGANNQTGLIIGRSNGLSAAAFPGIELHTDTTRSVSVARIYGGGTGARYAFMQLDDYSNRAVMGSSETGNPPGDDLWPLDLIAGGKTTMRLDTTLNVIVVGDENGQTPAAYTQNTFQIHADTTVSILAARIYNSGAGARYAILEVSDYDDVVKLVSTKTGTVPGSNAWPLQVWVGGTNTVTFYEDSTVANEKMIIRADLEKNDYLDLAGGAWLGATRDTISSIIPCVSFSHSGGDTAYYDLGTFPHAVKIDSLWLEGFTTSATGDSGRFVLGHRQVDFGSAYTGSFTTQNSNQVDLDTGSFRTKFRFTTQIALSANRRLLLKLYRDNSISNNSQTKIKVASVLVFGRGLK